MRKSVSSSILRALFHRWTWRMAWRDSRSERQRLFIFTVSILIGIAGLVTLFGLKDSVQHAIDIQGKALLGADLQITSRTSFSSEALETVRSESDAMSLETGFASMLLFPKTNTARLVQVRGLSGNYPFYGTVETQPASAWKAMLEKKGILVEPAMLDQFGLQVGDRAQLGKSTLLIVGTILKGAPRSSRFSGFAPEVMIQHALLEETGLLASNSLAFYHLQIKTDHADIVKKQLQKTFSQARWKYETPENRRESLEKVLADFQSFLGILALVALVLGAIGVASAIHAHISRRIQSIAVLRCLGCSSGSASAIYFAQAMLLGIGGAIIGAAIGIALHGTALWLFRDAVPLDISMMPRISIVIGACLSGILVCWAFAWLPLLRTQEVSPAEALRSANDMANRPSSRSQHRLRRIMVYPVLVISVFLTSLFGSHQWKQALAMTMGLIIAFIVLAGTARLWMGIARRLLRPQWPYLLRQGIANLYRPHNQTLLFLLSLGLGTFLLLTIFFVRNMLLDRITVSDTEKTPSLYLVDVQPDQAREIVALLGRQNLKVLQRAPMVTMRLKSVKGIPVETLRKNSKIPGWVLQREYRSTYRSELSDTEKLVEGGWFTGNATKQKEVPVSLERELAKDLDVKVGDTLELDVHGMPISAQVANIREVDWGQFGLNFFMVFPPGILEKAPGFEVITTRIPEGRSSGELQRLLGKKFSNVSAIDLTQILETVRSILNKINVMVQVLAGFSVAAGFFILTGTLLNGRDQRLREGVLLRTLGASSHQVRVIWIIEYAALGFLAALTGMFLAIIARWMLVVYVFKEASLLPNFQALWITPLIVVFITILSGILFSRKSNTQTPMEFLRM